MIQAPLIHSHAAAHPLISDRPAPDFFSGALLGNGGLGVVVCTRPDAIMLRFGHNEVWDIRVAERHSEKLGTFREVFARIEELSRQGKSFKDDPWYVEYGRLMGDNYSRVYPRPFPCGSLILGFDRRHTELLGHRVALETGICTVSLLHDHQPVTLHIGVEMATDRVWLRLLDQAENPIASIFDRVHLMPHLGDDGVSANTNGVAADGGPQIPPLPGHTVLSTGDSTRLAFHQILPNEELPAQPGIAHPLDHALRVTFASKALLGQDIRIGWHGHEVRSEVLHRRMEPVEAFLACVQIEHGLLAEVPPTLVPVVIDEAVFATALRHSADVWTEYWSRSAVRLADAALERLWYHNLYFLRCAMRPGVTCPGLFANWSFGSIGTAWHGDYHLNYNTQQPFWVTFSSNPCALNTVYVDMVHHLLPISRAWAQGFYGLRGACFPHSAYPTRMTMMPYPVPTWGWEICETPWVVQGLWWHYLYTRDIEFLRTRLMEPLEAATIFLVDYISRPEARGAAAQGSNPRFADDRWHIYPTVPPELYGLRDALDRNADCLVSLTLTRFVLRAFIQACTDLGLETEKQDVRAAAQVVLDHLPETPSALTPQGRVFVSVPGEDPSVTYNTPNATATVFPGEQHGLHTPGPDLETARNTLRWQQNEGGNDLVYLNLQAARMGRLDLEKFKRQVQYCMMPNGTCTDLAMQVHGRYTDALPFDFMARMGIWLENFALPVVVNECLMQSYAGKIMLFPNWPREKDAEFRTLRAAGAFLVSACQNGGTVAWIEILCERGGQLNLALPWPQAQLSRAGGAPICITGPDLKLDTSPGDMLRLIGHVPRI